MSRKVLIDCDLGIDDAVAVCLALFDSRLDVLAVTATAGSVDAHQANRNVQTLVERLDPPRWPRLGAAQPGDDPDVNGHALNGQDGLGNLGLQVSELQRQRPAEKVICDIVRDLPGDVTIIALGPLTNIAKAFARDPELPYLVHRLIIAGGSIHGVGNVTPAAEFNMYFDPAAARQVFRSATTKTLLPWETTSRFVMRMDMLDELPSEETRAGRLLRQLLPFAFRAYRQEVGLEGIYLQGPVALQACLQPELFGMQDMAGDVEVVGELTRGATVFDRRLRPEWRHNMEVAVEMDEAAVADAILRGLQQAGKDSRGPL
jgi:purine nucleosidase